MRIASACSTRLGRSLLERMPWESGPAAAYQRFCATHPLKQAALLDTTWRYIDCGRGQRTFLLIHGLVGDATGFSQVVESLESEHRVIAPTVPALDTMDEICRGTRRRAGERRC